MIEKRIKEAEKLGFKTCIIPEHNKKQLKGTYTANIIGVKNIYEVFEIKIDITNCKILLQFVFLL